MKKRRAPIRDHHAESALFARRSIVAMFLVVVVLFGLLLNMYQLQVLQHQQYQTRSNDNRIKVVPLAPNRGLIYDRRGRLLAENRPVLSLEIVPERVSDLDDTLSRLQQLLDLSDQQLEQFEHQRRRERRFDQVTLLENLSEQQAARFAVRQHEFPGVSIEARLIRYYPHGEALTHALGYVAKINRNDLQRLSAEQQSANYAATRTIGKLGIERFYEQQLHGSVGYQQIEVDIRGRAVRTLSVQPPSPGSDLTLELDLELQQFVYDLLGDMRGSIILLDPRDGAVRAMVSKPSFDPNWFVQGISTEQYQGLLSSRHSPLLNRSTQGGYPPASTIKPHLAVLALEQGIIAPHTKIWDPGWFQITGVDHRYRDWLAWGHGWVDVDTAIIESCDTFYYDIALRMGIDTISEHMAHYGFGELTDIDIHEESIAVLPSRAWKRARFNQPWYAGETVSIGIGQSYWTSTPIQLAVSTATLIRRGERPVPRLLHSLRTGDTETTAAVEYKAPLVLANPANWEVAIKAMNRVVSNIKGTAHRAFLGATYSSGGKTGTAQVRSIAQGQTYNADEVEEKYRDNAMYIGYAPVNNPQIVIMIAIENAGGGGSIAAPLARQILDYYFSLENAHENL